MTLSVEELKELLADYKPKLDFSKNNLICDCPECGQREFSVSLKDNHLFGCFRLNRCGFKGNIYTLYKITGKGRKLYEDINIIKYEDKFKAVWNENKQNLDKTSVELPDIQKPIGFITVQSNEYLNSRGFNKKQYEMFKPGITVVDPQLKNDYIIFLIERASKIKGFIGRHIWNKSEIEKHNKLYFEKTGVKNKIKRYRNSTGTKFSHLLYGIEEITHKTDTIILTEGIFDKFNIDRLLSIYEQNEIKVCCTFKCEVSDEQIFMLQSLGIKNIILLYDSDVLKQIKKNAIELEKYFNISVGYHYDTKKDPGDWTDKEIDYVLSNLKSPSKFFIETVQIPKFNF